MTQQLATDQDVLSKFKDRFEEIKQVKDSHLQSTRLSGLLTDMQSSYDMPVTGVLRIAAFKQAYPDVSDLYQEVKEAGGF
jgi:hypothetical protein